MKVSILKIALLGATAFVAACSAEKPAAETPATETSARETQVATPTGGGPAMWRLADDDSEVILFGTFHVLPKDVSWDTKAFDDAMARTETTVTEADVTSPAAQAAIMGLVQQYGANPPGVTLSSTLGAERAAAFAEICAKFGLPMQALEPYRPWFAMITVSAVAMQKSGFDASAGAEALVLARAGEEGDAIAHLETAEFQIKALASLDEEEMLANFDATIEQFEDFDAFTQRMLNAWRTGDVEALSNDILGDLRTQSPKAFETLIVARNRNWVEDISGYMEGSGDYFIAVGAGHLVGDDSVVDLLGARGYAVERIQ